MANKQALRELQTRLADRLQIARTEGVAASWLAVETGEKKYLFPLTQAGEIFSWVEPQAVPYTQEWFMGVANLRGGLFGIVDLESLIGGRPVRARSELSRVESRLLALNSALEVNCALWIDRLSGLRNQSMFRSFSIRKFDDPIYFGNSYVDIHNDTWQEINLQRLTQQDNFLAIGA
jgi:twitching motility protein PilI